MFQGREGFEWFTGIIEDRNDPLFLNRVRVRVFGIHTYDKQKIATADLPWAEVMMPTTTASLSGLGTTVHGLVEGSFVVGFFRDGIANQQPVVMGSFIGQPQFFSRIDETYDSDGNRTSTVVNRTPTEGFNDPRLPRVENYNLSTALDWIIESGASSTSPSTPDGNQPEHINRNYGLTLDLKGSPRRDGKDAGESYPKMEYLNPSGARQLHPADPGYKSPESSVNKLARQGGEYNKDIYPNNVIEAGGVGKTLFDGTFYEGGSNEDRSDTVRPRYPFNHVYESESGHVIEIDDTPDYERINVFHRSGARLEINNEGEIHILAAPGQDMNLQAANVNINNAGSGTLNIRALKDVIITAFKAAKIVSKGPTDIISSGETKITSLKDVIMKAVKKIRIQ